MFDLFALPTELVHNVIEAIDDRPTLIALAQTCQKLHPLAEAQLFKEIYIRDGTSVTRLAEALEQRPKRIRAIEKLEATPFWHGWQGIEQMPELVGRMQRLKSLKVESPLINSNRMDGWWSEGSAREYMDLFEVANGVPSAHLGRPTAAMEGAFGCLTSFTLHSHGVNSRYYSFESILPIFLSTTLKFIHVSCVELGSCTTSDFRNRIRSRKGCTSLETLILERCAAKAEGLQLVLSLPRALRCLALLLSRNMDVERQGLEDLGGPIANKFVTNIIEALEQQSGSLEHFRCTQARDSFRERQNTLQKILSLFGSSSATLRFNSPGLSVFGQLRILELDYRSPVTAVVFDPKLSPPNLHTLGISGIDYDFDRTWRHLPSYISAIASATSFSHLRLHASPCPQNFDDVFKTLEEPVFPEKAQRLRLLAVVESLRGRAGVELVSACNWRGSVVPPYVYTEPVPEERVIFDSRKRCSQEEADGYNPPFEMAPYVLTDGLGLKSFWCIGTKRF
ncbi:hypothetical protein BU23DRAFT_254999 [Bimuria novae-zelandiae CBS 107.79]|uniref:F-box domain-containing protein n=1 Tax=Bimuria novae-zelandiae CBS 107.79 TaxID=1447943 RepID=A0A6A5UYI3_9PLEO|nr:hypothetical protein BU23DRAFT_254999 [Bimuria novae-zelandiae CBS 107.79]